MQPKYHVQTNFKEQSGILQPQDAQQPKLEKSQSEKLEDAKNQIKPTVQAFQFFDKDGSGVIDQKNFEEVTKGMGLRKQFSQSCKDKNIDTELKFTDVLDLMQDEPASPYLREAFKVFDKDGEGQITIAELKDMMRGLGEELTNTELMHILKLEYIDDNYTISQRQFQKLFQ